MTAKFDEAKMRIRLKEAVDANDMSQNEISRRSGNSVSYVSGVINGSRDPQVSKLVSVCDVLGVSLIWLLYGFDVPEGADEILQHVAEKPEQTDAVISLLRAQQPAADQD
ncbi:hypothetical protein GCM10007385_35200 [Tateyamaria omphalii]|uniref:helix-turn-helix domain-containing protein n=1 Tax=Tateyamaria omphalii TaxID=299262 RepID=UPI0016722584|nr:helix-turn-helix transcriptional regulator [Tateyamaria omphalii]GGX63032.1 hypothetical protein GCM10007385_35200 [Tateyamaria omphalii]